MLLIVLSAVHSDDVKHKCCAQNVLELHVLEQHSLLELQLAATEASPQAASHAGTSHMSAGSFLPLLKLLTGSPSHGVRQLAGKLLGRRMTNLLGNSSAEHGQEEQVWLGMLPRMLDGATAANKSVRGALFWGYPVLTSFR